jgi:hypothetical protein
LTRGSACRAAAAAGVQGHGATGAGIFCREAQAVWPELHPFVDDKALGMARELGLGSDSEREPG